MLNRLLPSYIWGFLLICYCGLIYWLSNQSTLPVPLVFHMQDKLSHAAAYAGMAFLAWQAATGLFHPDGSGAYRALALCVVLFCSLYGVSDEWHQSFVVGRDASFFDWLADTVGASLLTAMLYKRERVLLRQQ